VLTVEYTDILLGWPERKKEGKNRVLCNVWPNMKEQLAERETICAVNRDKRKKYKKIL
jgi:hypothetical protein